MNSREEILQRLCGLNIEYRLFEHAPVHTMEDLSPIDELIGRGEDVLRVRNLFLSNRGKTKYYLLLLPGFKPFHTSVVSRAAGTSRLCFGDEENLYRLLRAKPGAVTPLGLIFDVQHEITLLVDSEILNHRYISFHPGENTASAVMKSEDFMHIFVPDTGANVQIIEFGGER